MESLSFVLQVYHHPSLSGWQSLETFVCYLDRFDPQTISFYFVSQKEKKNWLKILKQHPCHLQRNLNVICSSIFYYYYYFSFGRKL